jgi:cytochrome c553
VHVAQLIGFFRAAQNSIMKSRRHAIVSTLSVCALTLGCRHAQVPLTTIPPAMLRDTASSAARGEYIVRSVAVCGSCHAADEKQPDGPLSGGKEFHD